MQTPKKSKNKSKQSIAIPIGAFAIGALAGALAGVLFAPKSGKETREDIKDAVAKINRDVAHRLSSLKEVTEDKYHQIVESVVGAYEKNKDVTQAQARVLKKDLRKGYGDLKKIAAEARAKAK